MNKIQVTIEFDSYKLCRVKPQNNTGIIYPYKKWIGEMVCAIPVPYIISEKVIERNKDETGKYHLTFKTNEIIHKEVKDNKTTGRIYVPSHLIGADLLVVIAPQIDYF